jgi:hypothetical protein
VACEYQVVAFLLLLLLGCVQRRSLYWVLNLWISSLTAVIIGYHVQDFPFEAFQYFDVGDGS